MVKTVFSLKLDSDQRDILTSKAVLEGVSLGEYIRQAAMEKALADLNIQNELIGSLEVIRNYIGEMKAGLETSSVVFNEFLKYFFLMHNIGQSIPANARSLAFEKAEKDREYMFTLMKKNLKSKRTLSLIEQWTADFMEIEKNEGGDKD